MTSCTASSLRVWSFKFSPMPVPVPVPVFWDQSDLTLSVFPPTSTPRAFGKKSPQKEMNHLRAWLVCHFLYQWGYATRITPQVRTSVINEDRDGSDMFEGVKLVNEDVETHFDMLDANEVEGEEIPDESYKPCGRSDVFLRWGRGEAV